MRGDEEEEEEEEEEECHEVSVPCNDWSEEWYLVSTTAKSRGE